MADRSLFCPYCGAEQIKPDARFCHVCGQPIPAASTGAPEPAPRAARRQRRLNGWWLLPLLALAIAASAILVWKPGRDGIAGLLSGGRPATDESANRGAGTSARVAFDDAPEAVATEAISALLTETRAAKATASLTTTVPPSATLRPAAVSLPTATPPDTATPVPMVTPLGDITVSAIVQPGSLGLIAFYSERDGNAEIYIMDADGGNQRRLTANPGSDLYPALSPDGQRIAFVSQRDGNSEIYVMDSDGSDLMRLTNDAAEDRLPAWSPDGKRIAFASDRSGNADLYVVDVDGQNLVQLTSGPERDGHPAWSPDGAWLAYNSGGEQQTTWEIKTIAATGGTSRKLTDNAVIDWSPCWAADGSSILFLSRRSAQNAIYSVSPDGSQERKFFEGLESVWGAVWSPDDQYVAFTSGESGRDEIYVIRSDGSDLRPLTSEGGAYPSWR